MGSNSTKKQGEGKEMLSGYYLIDGKGYDRRIITPDLFTLKECLEYAKKHDIEFREWK
jgi:hypothetical protein